MRSQLQQKPQHAGGPVAMRRRKDGEGGSSTATCGGETGCALSAIAQRANAGPHAEALAGMRSVVAQRTGVSGGPVVQRVLRVNNKNFTSREEIEAAVPKYATSLQIDRLVEMGEDGERYKYASWKDAIDALPPDLDVSDDEEEVDLEKVTREHRLANLDNVVREWAKRAGGHDSSGHGAGKKISSGHSKDRHQHGQKRKTQHKATKVGSLESALRMFAQEGGTRDDLDPSTIKLLNSSGVSWSGFLEDVEEEEL